MAFNGGYLCLEHLDRKTKIRSTVKILTYSGYGKLMDCYNFLLELPYKHLAFLKSSGLNIQKLMLMDRCRTEMIPKDVLQFCSTLEESVGIPLLIGDLNLLTLPEQALL